MMNRMRVRNLAVPTAAAVMLVATGAWAVGIRPRLTPRTTVAEKVDRATHQGRDASIGVSAAGGTPTLTLNFLGDKTCFLEGEVLCITVDSSELGANAVDGGQFFLLYDQALLQFNGMAPGDHTAGTDAAGCPGAGDSDFNREFIQYNDAGNGRIEYVVGSPAGFQGSTASQTMATMKFTAMAEGSPFVSWDHSRDPNNPQPPLTNRLSDGGQAVLPLNLHDLNLSVGEWCIDETDPIINETPEQLACEIECDEDPAICPVPTASDNCILESLTYADEVTEGNCPQEQTITRTWTATDHCLNTATVVQTITVVDTQAPVLSGIPADTTVECDSVPSPAQPTADDVCDAGPISIAFLETRENGSCPNNYTLTRTWTATDACGNSSSGTQVITVVDTTPPDIMGVPADVSVDCDNVPPPADVTAMDNCCGPNTAGGTSPVICVDLTYDEVRIDGDCPDNYTLERTWTATDGCGNTVSKTQIITVSDTTGPRLSGVPADMTADCDDIPQPPTVTADDICDDEPIIVNYREDRSEGSCLDSYTLTRTWSAMDACGNTTSESQIITVVDMEAPVLAGVPQDGRVECDAVPQPGMPTATDNCDPGPISPLFEEVGVDGSCIGEYTLTRTWTVMDRCGNEASGNQVLSVVDTTAPVFEDEDIDGTVECNGLEICLDPYNPDCTLGVPTANDNCNGAELSFDDDDSGLTGCAGTGTLIRTWTAKDDCGNISLPFIQTITVIDSGPPEMTPPGDARIECDEPTHPDNTGWPTGSDECNGVVFTWVDDSPTYLSCEDNYMFVRHWTATDGCGNTTPGTQTIWVSDTTPPDLDVPADEIVECGDCTAPGQCLPGATAKDNCDGNPVVTFVDSFNAGSCSLEGVITRTWTAVDACGNSVSADQLITVEDTTPPELLNSPPSKITVDCDFNIPAPDPNNIEAADDCSPEVTITVERMTYGGDFQTCLEVVDTYTICDDCDNCIPGGFIQTFNVMDKSPPRLKGPDNILVECMDDMPPIDISEIQAADNCGAVKVIHWSDTEINDICPRIVERKFRAFDRCGNPAEFIQDITVDDEEDPLVTCPGDITVKAEAGGCTAVVDTPPCAESDNCGIVESNCERDDGQPLDAPYDAGTTKLTCTAMDMCGNIGTDEQYITVLAVNEVLLDVCYRDQMAQNPSTRCINFEFVHSGGTVYHSESIDFGPQCGQATFDIECVPEGYDCALAQDPFHSLVAEGVLFDAGATYLAEWRPPLVLAGDALPLGNAVDIGQECIIDILDFGATQFRQANLGPPMGGLIGADTICGDPVGRCVGGPNITMPCADDFACLGESCVHSDFNGDGAVQSVDTAIWLANYGEWCDTCRFGGDEPGGVAGDGPRGAIMSITVDELYRLGLQGLAIGDLTGDGVLDIDDVTASLSGAKPDPNSVHLIYSPVSTRELELPKDRE